MTLKQKREIVEKFMIGHSLDGVTVLVWNATAATKDHRTIPECRFAAEEALRDYLNGKFTLEPRKREKFVGVSIPMPKDETFKGIVLDKPEAWIPKPQPKSARKRKGQR